MADPCESPISATVKLPPASPKTQLRGMVVCSMPRQRLNHSFSLSSRASVSAGWTLGESAQSDGVGGGVGGRLGRGVGLAVGSAGLVGSGPVVGSGAGVGSSGQHDHGRARRWVVGRVGRRCLAGQDDHRWVGRIGAVVDIGRIRRGRPLWVADRRRLGRFALRDVAQIGVGRQRQAVGHHHDRQHAGDAGGDRQARAQPGQADQRQTEAAPERLFDEAPTTASPRRSTGRSATAPRAGRAGGRSQGRRRRARRWANATGTASS